MYDVENLSIHKFDCCDKCPREGRKRSLRSKTDPTGPPAGARRIRGRFIVIIASFLGCKSRKI